MRYNGAVVYGVGHGPIVLRGTMDAETKRIAVREIERALAEAAVRWYDETNEPNTAELDALIETYKKLRKERVRGRKG